MQGEDGDDDGSAGDGADEGVPQKVLGCITCNGPAGKRWYVMQAFLKIVAALLLIAILADPFVDAVSRFGELVGIPGSIMAAVIPIVSNLNELIASVLFTANAVKGKNSMMFVVWGRCCVVLLLLLVGLVTTLVRCFVGAVDTGDVCVMLPQSL
jgi:hypothetical protein